jgi:hypothetical protein
MACWQKVAGDGHAPLEWIEWQGIDSTRQTDRTSNNVYDRDLNACLSRFKGKKKEKSTSTSVSLLFSWEKPTQQGKELCAKKGTMMTSQSLYQITVYFLCHLWGSSFYLIRVHITY